MAAILTPFANYWYLSLVLIFMLVFVPMALVASIMPQHRFNDASVPREYHVGYFMFFIPPAAFAFLTAIAIFLFNGYDLLDSVRQWICLGISFVSLLAALAALIIMSNWAKQ